MDDCQEKSSEINFSSFFEKELLHIIDEIRNEFRISIKRIDEKIEIGLKRIDEKVEINSRRIDEKVNDICEICRQHESRIRACEDSVIQIRTLGQLASWLSKTLWIAVGAVTMLIVKYIWPLFAN